MGFSGYYNPFSGEAQVNTTIPRFVQPFTTCHEIGPVSLGMQKKRRLIFADFLQRSLLRSGIPVFCVCGSCIFMGQRALPAGFNLAFIPYRESIKPTVRKDLRDLSAFYRHYQNPFEPIIHLIYGRYLKANRQPQGINSYDEVVGLAIAYYSKYGPAAF